MFCMAAMIQAPRIHVTDSRVHSAVTRAVLAAQVRLGRPACERVLTDFQGTEGRPLLDRLMASDMTAADYLVLQVWFIDGDETPQCRHDDDAVAFTEAGGHVVRICSARFMARLEQQPVAAEMIVIHEMLHTLGLGENPPSSREITAQVTKRCGTS